MYLFTRRTRLAGGNGMAGVEWAASIGAKVREITGQEIQLWSTVWSPGYGTISWTSWFADLASLEAVGDKLAVDPSYLELANAGAKFTEGGLDDSVLQLIHGEPDPSRPIQYVAGTVVVAAAGNIERSMTAAMEIVQKGEAVTGHSTMLVRPLTGPYGSLGFLTGYENIADLEAAGDAMAADPGWLKMLDATEGCFVEDAAITQTTFYRKMG